MTLPLYFSIFWIIGLLWVNHKIVILTYDTRLDLKNYL